MVLIIKDTNKDLRQGKIYSSIWGVAASWMNKEW